MSPAELRRVLVIDDEPDILAVLRSTLRNRGGFEVEVCASGAEALDVARRFAPDLILLDVMMPGIDGPTILEALRDDPETAETPVVFMTAKTMPHETARYRELGAAAVIAKPFNQRTLSDELEQIFRRTASFGRDEGGDYELDSLLKAYAEALPAKVGEIRELWSRVESGSDAEAASALRLCVHRLAGTAATYEHPKVGEVARQLEHALGDGRVDTAEPAPGARETAPGLIDALEALVASERKP